ncbi:MAG: HAMP domain-containing protein [Burkholderiales bacterium]|nr:HAMP domain-containing protein [Burkholderiales bacterium]
MKTRSIAITLFLTITATALCVVLAMAMLFRVSLVSGFGSYVAEAELQKLDRIEHYLADRYQQEGGWGFVRGPRDMFPPGMAGPPHPEEGGAPPPPHPRPPGDIRELLPRLALYDRDGVLLAGPPESQGRPRRAVLLPPAGTIIGYMALAPMVGTGDAQMMSFLNTQTRNLALIAGFALIASALVAWLLGRYFSGPITQLIAAARALASGKLDARVKLDRDDELGQLGEDFNAMAQRLERFEQSRRQWVADTSHELRTPLTVLRAHTQAMRDGVMPVNERGLAVLDGAASELEGLVNSLYQLARADVGMYDFRSEPVPLAELLNETAERFAEPLRKAQLTLSISCRADIGVHGDPGKLQQLFGNLLTNSIRYTDPGGRIQIVVERIGKQVGITIDDTAPGVPASALPRLFERFFRVDASRSRQAGGSGLGLSICQSIVEGHQGEIKAVHSALGGLCVHVTLPAAMREAGTP